MPDGLNKSASDVADSMKQAAAGAADAVNTAKEQARDYAERGMEYAGDYSVLDLLFCALVALLLTVIGIASAVKVVLRDDLSAVGACVLVHGFPTKTWLSPPRSRVRIRYSAYAQLVRYLPDTRALAQNLVSFHVHLIHPHPLAPAARSVRSVPEGV